MKNRAHMDTNQQRVIGCDRIQSDLRELGLRQGDTVFFHASLKSIGWVEGGADGLIDAFMATLGNDGTLVLPTLCKYDWKQWGARAIEQQWDIAATPAFTGSIPEALRKRKESIRSNHPTHSICALGKHARNLCAGHEMCHTDACDNPHRPRWIAPGAFGPNSPWDKLCKLNAHCLFIGVDFTCCTLFHHVQVCLLLRGTQEHARQAPWPQLDFFSLGRMLEARGLVSPGMLGNAGVKRIGCRDLVEHTVAYLSSDPSQSIQPTLRD